MKKLLLTHLIAFYLGAGVFGALLVKQGVPPINLLGMSYLIGMWPKVLYCTPVNRGCEPMPPEWLAPFMFSFEGTQ